MRPNVYLARPGVVPPIPEPSGSATRAAAVPARERARLTMAGAGFLIYLWVVHSGRAPIGAAAIVMGLIGLVMQQQRLRVPAPLLWFAALLLWAGFGYFSALQPSITADTLWDYTKIGLIFLLATNVARTKGQYRWMMIAWLAIFAVYPVRGTLSNIAFGITTNGRYAWNYIFSNPNDLTTLSLPVLAMSVAVLQSSKEKWIRICALGGATLIPIIIFATQSRGGILALITFASLVLLHYRKRLGALLVAAMIIGVVIQMAPPEVWKRIASLSKVTSKSTIAEADQYGSAEQRSDIWGVARAIIADHPVTGVGIGAYGSVHARYAATGRFKGFVGGPRDPHSTYLGTAAEVGLLGLALFLGMLVSVFVVGWRGVRQLKHVDPGAATSLRTLLYGLIAFLQACLFATMTHLPFLYIYIAIICAMVAVHQPQAPIAAPQRSPRRSRG